MLSLFSAYYIFLIRGQPPFSFPVLRSVNRFAGPCETSPGCFDSSHSRTVPVTQVSGYGSWLFPWLSGALGDGVGFNAHHETCPVGG